LEKDLRREIEEILVTVFDTKLKDLEEVSSKNMNNLILAYPGNLDCAENLDCLSRQAVANNLFRGAIDVYAGLDAALQAVCVTADVNIPHSVIIANLMGGRPLDASEGFAAAGYVPSGARLQKKLKGVQDLYTRTQAALANIQAMSFTKKRKKRAILGFAIGAVAIGTIINSVQIVTISGEVSALGKEIEILKTRAEFNKNHTISLITTLGEEVRLNSLFDSVGQLITMARRDGEELVQIV
jgi:hypothetical protein